TTGPSRARLSQAHCQPTEDTFVNDTDALSHQDNHLTRQGHPPESPRRGPVAYTVRLACWAYSQHSSALVTAQSLHQRLTHFALLLIVGSGLCPLASALVERL